MKNAHFVTDMAIEAAASCGFGELATEHKLAFGIVERSLNIKDDALAKRIGRPRGVYVTYDCSLSLYDSDRAASALEKYISSTLVRLLGTLKKSSPLLIVGLGNSDISADALGAAAVRNIKISAQDFRDSYRQCVCAFVPGVAGQTGLQTATVLSALAERIKPCAIIAVDSLATGTASRIGASYQISTAGIAPGSGVGQDKERIDKSVLKAPVIAIGVPMMLSLRTAIYSFIKDFYSDNDIDEYRLRSELAEHNLSGLQVTPKDIDFLVKNCATVISNAINAMIK